MHAEVAAVDQLLLQLGGASCGWDAGDHAAYMRLRVQCLGGSASPPPPQRLPAQPPLPAARAPVGTASASKPTEAPHAGKSSRRLAPTLPRTLPHTRRRRQRWR